MSLTTPATNLADLAANLRTQANTNSTIVLDGSVFSATVLANLRTAFALGPTNNLTISGVHESDIPQNPSGSLVISPTTASATLLNQKNIPIQLEFTVASGTIEAVIKATMGPSWKFSASFSDLNTFPFNQLDFSGPNLTVPQFIYTTSAQSGYEWPNEPTYKIALVTGLNFLAEITLQKFTLAGAILGSIVNANPVKLYGPFSPTAGQQLPVGKIKAPLASGTFTVGSAPNSLSLAAPAVAFQVTAAASSMELQSIDLLIEADFDNDKMEVALALPAAGNTFSLSAAPPPNASFSVTDLIGSLPRGKGFQSYIPAELSSIFNNIGLDSFYMIVDTTPKVNSLGLVISTVHPWTVVPSVLVLDQLKLRIALTDPSGMNWLWITLTAEAEFLPNIFPGEFDFTVELERQTPNWLVSTVSGVYGGSVSLGHMITEILANPNPSPVPAVLQDIQFSDFGLTATRSTPTDPFTYAFSGSAEAAFPLLGTELSSQLYISVTKSPSAYTIDLSGGLAIGDQSFSLELDLGTSGALLYATWQAADDSGLDIATLLGALGLDAPALPAGVDLTLVSAGLGYDFTNQALVLFAKSKNYGAAIVGVSRSGSSYSVVFSVALPDLSSLPVIGSSFTGATLAGGGFRLIFASSAVAATAVTALNNLATTLAKTVPDVDLRFDGPLDKGLTLYPTGDPQVTIPLPGTGAAVHLGLGKMALAETTSAAGTSSWSIDASISLSFTGLPKTVQDILADKITASFKVDGTGAQISIDQLIKPVSVPIPDMTLGTYTIKLGTLAVSASSFDLKLGKDLALSADFGLGLPSGLNTIFGKNSAGSPAVELFNVYQPGNDATITKFSLGISTTAGLSVSLLTSPFKAVTFDQGVCKIDLGTYGALSCQVPVFSYKGTAFQGSGSFTITKPLKLPTAPFKLLLKACGLSAAADNIPDGIPLQGLQLLDSQGQFDLNAFYTIWDDMRAQWAQLPALPDAVKTSLNALTTQFNQLPDQFKEYLNFTVPQGLSFSISVTPDGGARGTLSTAGSPLRLLLPSFGPLGPALTGLTLNSISFGEALGGSLGVLQIDAVIDSFDLVTLAATVALPAAQLSAILPSTKNISRRLILHNLFAIIIYETVIPIPIPLTYDQIGIEYQGLEGLALQAHLSLPAPQVTASGALQLFSNFKDFLTQQNTLLPDTPPQGIDIKFTLGPNFITLPPYLGGKTLGSPTATTTISTWSLAAHALNAAKTLSLNEIVQAIPLDERVGSESVSLGSMTLSTAWLITTPAEFRQTSASQLKIAAGQIDGIMQVLPGAKAGSDPQGLVVFLRGDWSIANALSLDTVFGLIGTGAGFATGLLVTGTINGILDLTIGGSVVINSQPAAGANAFSLAAQVALNVLGQPVFAGSLSISDQQLSISGALDLFPGDHTIQGSLSGTIGNDQLSVAGSVSVNLSSAFPAQGTVSVTQTDLSLNCTWLGQAVSFKASQDTQGGLRLDGAVSLGVGDALKLSGTATMIIPPNTPQGSGGATLAASGTAQVLGLSTQGTMNFSHSGFDLQISGQIFGAFQAQVELKGPTLQSADVITVTATMQSDLYSYLSSNAGAQIKAATANTGLVTVTNASFSGSLSAVQGGQVSLAVTVSFLGATRSLTLSFDFKDPASAAKTLGNMLVQLAGLHPPHLDTAAIPHVDTPLVPHLDTATPHADTKVLPHGDTAAKHADTAANSHADTPSKHGDTAVIPHVDTAAQHADIKHIDGAHVDGAHVDGHDDTHDDTHWAGLHTDGAHVDSHDDTHDDTHADTPHGDGTLIPHGDTAAIPHGDGTAIPHTDTAVPHFDHALVPHVDTAAAHVDTAAAHVDTPQTAHLDTAAIPHGDT